MNPAVWTKRGSFGPGGRLLTAAIANDVRRPRERAGSGLGLGAAAAPGGLLLGACPVLRTALPGARATALLLRGGQARLERGHEVGHLLGLLGHRLEHDLLALRLPLDHAEHGLAVLVVVLPRLELGGQVLDQLPRHLELALGRVDVVAWRLVA